MISLPEIPEQTPGTPNYPVIPETIVVHLGRPGQAARNIEVPFGEYIKNVASSEIYPTWPEEALRANILAQISFALNRIYTEWYPSRGYDFDITSSTQYDQAFVEGRDVFENISVLVDEIFNDYIRREGRINPLFAQFCSGTTVTCEGLSQWGSVELANRGLTAEEILRYYYGDDIELVEDAPVAEIPDSYPGRPLEVGQDSGNDVYTIQLSLNRIRQNFPAIPRIPNEDGVFDLETEAAVKVFQSVFNLPVTGIVDKATWYRIKEIYTSVKKLSDLTGEGISPEEVTPLYPNRLTIGDAGISAATVQYYLNVISYFNDQIPEVPIDGIYSADTAASVAAFQQQYGLEPTGITDGPTWYKMQEIYRGILSIVDSQHANQKPAIYPGYILVQGMRGNDVENLQRYLTTISSQQPAIPLTEVTGYFGPRTKAAVEAFQEIYGIPVNGRVGALTWNTITYVYRMLTGESG